MTVYDVSSARAAAKAAGRGWDIGYQELSNLLLLCNEVFSTKQIMPIAVQTSGGKPNGCFNVTHNTLSLLPISVLGLIPWKARRMSITRHSTE